MVRTRVGAFCVIWAFVAATAAAQPAAPKPRSGDGGTPYEVPAGEPLANLKVGKIYYAARVTKPPQIDGRMDDEVWATAEAIEDLVQTEPDNLAKPTERTVVKIAFDNRYLYVAAYCYAHDAATIRAGLGRRGNMPPSDMFAVGIDPQHDHRSGYSLQTNASGVQHDMTVSDDSRMDSDWDGVWEVVTSTTNEGWFAEFRIPFSQMRFAVRPGQRVVIGMNWRRTVQYRGEWDDWVPLPRGTQGLSSAFGHVVLDDQLSTPRRLELLPYTLASREARSGISAEHRASAGLDARIGLGTSATASVTINPDFGQVEADPAVLNLSVFETFFPEKRPFFTEDSRIFNLSQFGQMPDFYSRRIGQRPGRIPLQTGDTLVSRPDDTTILAAGKLIGQKSQWTYGGLAALTSNEYATVDATTTDLLGRQTTARTRRLIEPRTMYSVGRLQRDLGGGSSTLGAIGTAVVREGDFDAFTGGGDANVRWGNNAYNWNSHWVGTHAAVSGAMRSDFGGVSNFYYNGKYLDYGAHYDHFGANFRNTDLGFLGSRPNKNEVNGNFGLAQPDPKGIFRYLGGFWNFSRQWNDDGLVFGSGTFGGMNINLRNYWNGWFNVGHSFDHLDDLDTRGGPPIRRLPGNYFNGGFNSDSRKTWGWSMFTNIARSRAGDNTFLGAGVRVQPSTRLQANVGVNYTRGHDVAQWIKNVDADADGATDYVYGELRRHVVSITGRTTFAFTRDMTLEMYVQPFAAVGDYLETKKLARERSFEFARVVLPDNPDFNSKSLRSTVVLRWEYIRGSTLYAVWNVANQDTSRPGVFSPWRDLAGGFGAPGTNVFAVKVSYWFTP